MKFTHNGNKAFHTIVHMVQLGLVDFPLELQAFEDEVSLGSETL